MSGVLITSNCSISNVDKVTTELGGEGTASTPVIPDIASIWVDVHVNLSPTLYPDPTLFPSTKIFLNVFGYVM